MSIDYALWLVLGAGVLALLYGAFTVRWVLSHSTGNERMREIAMAIQEGAKAYLNRQYMTISMVGLALFFVLGIALDWWTALGFAIGAALSGIAGYLGMIVSVRANVRTAEAARGGINAALSVAFRSGAITGICVFS